MKKFVRFLMLTALALILVACNQEASSYDTSFKEIVKNEGMVVLSSSPMSIQFTEEGVAFTGLLTTATPSDDPEDIHLLLPVEEEVIYDYSVEKSGDILTLNVVTPDEEFSYPLEIKGAQLLLDQANSLTYTSTYSFE